jgi:hypothetical protein
MRSDYISEFICKKMVSGICCGCGENCCAIFPATTLIPKEPEKKVPIWVIERGFCLAYDKEVTNTGVLYW